MAERVLPHHDEYEKRLMALICCTPFGAVARQAVARTLPAWLHRDYSEKLLGYVRELLESHPAPAMEGDGERLWGPLLSYVRARDPRWYDERGRELLAGLWEHFTFSLDEGDHVESIRWLHERLIHMAIARVRIRRHGDEAEGDVRAMTPEEYAERRHTIDRELATLEAEWLKFSSPRRTFTDLWESAVLRDRHRRSSEGFTFGFRSLDSHGGAAPGDFVIVAGRAGVGKTTFVANVVNHRSSVPPEKGRERWGAFFSLDMKAEAIVQKLVMCSGRLRASEALDPQYPLDLTKVTESWQRFRNVEINDDESPTALDIVAECQLLAREHGGDPPEFVVVDYHGRVRPSSRNLRSQYERASETASDLKSAAKQLNTVMIVLTQLSREAKGGDVEPELHMLRDTGRLEEEADTILGLWREDDRVLGMKIMKARMMPLGKFSLEWDPATGYVGDVQREDAMSDSLGAEVRW